MQLFFADDGRQKKPFRKGMGPLVAMGAIAIDADKAGPLEKEMGTLCEMYGFPKNQPFKWSPGKGLWMKDSLVEERRREFFIDALSLAAGNGTKALSVVVDEKRATATPRAPSHEIDAMWLLLERIETALQMAGEDGMVILAQPSGGSKDEKSFIKECIKMLDAGTSYVKPARIALPVLSTLSQNARLLQLADLITSCTLALVAGESKYAPPIFDLIKPMLLGGLGRLGGVGLKIHPDFLYANLYHWLLEDTHLVRAGSGHPLPLKNFPYSSDPREP